ncbi:ferrous iron transporter B, partial [Parvibacter caecicola]
MGLNIALAGNPNCGKTTMFNDLTGANQYVGNWPGVTVEKKEGKYKGDKSITVTDLPGVYSLSPYSPEEIVTRDYLLSGAPDVVVNLVDATNLERNLYLTTQIINLGVPVVVALNMMDLVEKNGDKIDVAKLSQKIGCPIVETTALRGRGMEDLMNTAIEAAKKHQLPASTMRFTNDVEEALGKIIDILGSRVKGDQARWFAIKLFEGEQMTIDGLGLSAGDLSKIAAIREAVENDEDDDAESIITDERYGIITDVADECVKKSTKGMTTTQKIDRVVTNRILGLPIFVVIMFLVYYISVSTVGTYVTDWANDGLFGDGWLYTGTEQYEADAEEYEGYQAQIDAYLEAAEEDGLDVEGFTAAIEAEEPTVEDEEAIENFMYAADSAGIVGELEVEDEDTGAVSIERVDSAAFAAALEQEEPDPADYGFYHVGVPVVVGGWLEAIDAAPWVQSLILDGIIAGVGAVIGFIPQLIVLFILLGILEGCGYMARVAFIMDRIFRRFGLSGKSFIPMLIASGCGVPAVMA